MVNRQLSGKKWEEGLEFSKELVKAYLNESNKSYILKEKNAVAIGFIDGDLNIIYKNK